MPAAPAARTIPIPVIATKPWYIACALNARERLIGDWRIGAQWTGAEIGAAGGRRSGIGQDGQRSGRAQGRLQQRGSLPGRRPDLTPAFCSGFERWVADHGYQRIDLGVVGANASALSFWQRQGFHHLRTAPDQVFGRLTHDVLVMSKNIS